MDDQNTVRKYREEMSLLDSMDNEHVDKYLNIVEYLKNVSRMNN